MNYVISGELIEQAAAESGRSLEDYYRVDKVHLNGLGNQIVADHLAKHELIIRTPFP